MPAPLAEIVAHADEILDAPAFEDYAPNGLQVPGAETVSTVVTGVSGQLELFERARDIGAELVLVHHGILWNADPRRIGPALARRLRVLLTNDIALAAYHLPLDANAGLGNNALLARGLGATGQEPFSFHGGRAIGVRARFPGDGVSAPELFARVAELTGRDPLVFDAGPAHVRTIGIVSGGAARDVNIALAEGLDAFLTGEPTESVMADAREGGIHFIAAGHYATETFGIRALGDHLAGRFDLDHHFVDLPNPI
jgi:dinuclear metal center YbgI/SA1388 family protein